MSIKNPTHAHSHRLPLSVLLNPFNPRNWKPPFYKHKMEKIQKLEDYYQQVQSVILDRQNPITGLLPASTAINEHGDYTDAWVRDNVYSILAVWGLALAYQHTDESAGRTYVLKQSVVKLMRGLLTCMMHQAHKVERFKHTLDPMDALHAKYNTYTGDIVVGDHEWGHLQLDATSLYLLMMAQMTASGLRIIFTLDEVNFVQNLVHYISRAYRIPDYGIWERGNKSNHGIAELNASSVGMAKAALEAMSGFNLFGSDGGHDAVIHVMSDEIARCRIALESILPRESISKEVDSAVLSVTGFPAFAIDDPEVLIKTEQRICEKLQGRYGCKRFLLDGHQTVIEDSHRMYYEENELKQFMHIECEWPLFFCYSHLNHLFAGNLEKAREYRENIHRLLVEQDGQQLLPELYIVAEENIEAERVEPQSQKRFANENIPLVWAQSLYILGEMIQENLLEISDLDPLKRSQKLGRTLDTDLKVQLTLLAETASVQSKLKKNGIHTQTIEQIAPLQIKESSELASAYTQVGRNKALGLSGRPNKQIRSMGTSLLYMVGDEKILFLPQFMNQQGFFLALDNRFLFERLRLELRYIYQYWDRPGKPLIAMVVKPNMLDNQGLQVLLEFMDELKQGTINKVPVQLGSLAQFLDKTSYEKINYLHDFEFSHTKLNDTKQIHCLILPVDSTAIDSIANEMISKWEKSDDEILIQQLMNQSNLVAQLEILTILYNRHGLDHELVFVDKENQQLSVRDLLEEIYMHAGNMHAWHLIRRCAGILGKYDIDLEQAATDILVRQKRLSVGREYSNRATFQRPGNASDILERIRIFNINDVCVHIIIQELIIYLGLLIKSDPDLFTDMHTVRVGHIMQLISVRLQRKLRCSMEKAFHNLLAQPPHEIAQQVKETLSDYQNVENQLNHSETLHYEGQYKHLDNARFSEQYNPADRGRSQDWHEWREQRGSVGRESETFFESVWEILKHTDGLIIGDELSSKRRVDSEKTLAQMTANEKSFVLLINHRLDKVKSPDFRQLTVESLLALAVIFKENPDLHVNDTLLTDTLINHAVRINWLRMHPERAEKYEQDHALSWQGFYQLPPNEVANAIIEALNYLLDSNNNKEGVTQ